MAFFEDYTLLMDLGQGSFARVYKVRHNKLGYIRAIKVLNENITDESDDAYRKFLRECELLLRLGNGNHPNIVHIYQPLLKDHAAIVEMDYVEGDAIDQYLNMHKNFVPTDEVIKLATDIGSALAYCHVDIYKYCVDKDIDDVDDDPNNGKGFLISAAKREQLIKKYRVIHNDIHPGNIIRNTHGHYILLDFGLSISEGDTGRSSVRRNGAREFKSPEKWDGKEIPTTESDIYSFGALLYYFLTGNVPFQFDQNNPNDTKAEYQLMTACLEGTPEPIYNIRKASYEKAFPDKQYSHADYPAWLETVIMKCLNKRPHDRFCNGKELYDFICENSKRENRFTNAETDRNNCQNDELNKELERAQTENRNLRKQIEQLQNSAADRTMATDIKTEMGRTEMPKMPVTSRNPKRRKKPVWVTILIIAVLLLIGVNLARYFTDNNGMQTFTVGGVEFKMVLVDGGTFLMGSQADNRNEPNYSSNAQANELPIHEVTLSDYRIGQTEVTQALWQTVMGTSIRNQRDSAHPDWPIYGEGADYPMYYVNQDEVQAFLASLNGMLHDELQGQCFVLPTEEQWEFAAAGGQNGYNANGSRKFDYSGSNNIDDVAWYSDNSNDSAHPVRTKSPNALGIYDMTGNVSEWCDDESTGINKRSYHVYRGGSWHDTAGACRLTAQKTPLQTNFDSKRYRNLGFRLALISQ